jgi:malate-CoA ligase subunit alpha
LTIKLRLLLLQEASHGKISGPQDGSCGTIIQAFGESASQKVEILRKVGVAIALTPAEIGITAQCVLKAA